MTNAVVIENLTQKFKDFSLEDINLIVPQGTVFGLVGENGAGKSTLINSMLEITNPNYKTLNYFGMDFQNNQREIKESIAVIFDQTYFDLEFTPIMLGKIMRNVYKEWNSDLYADFLKRFQLPLNKKIKKFSRGMKMKLEFAVAFSHNTKLMILDEATSGLDPIFRDELLSILREYSEHEEHTIIMSSHITSDLDKIADYIGFIHQGKLLFVMSYEDIREHYGIVKCNKATFDSLNEDDIVAFKKEDYSYSVLVKNKYEIRKHFIDLIMENATLEDVMLYLVKGEKK